MGTVTLIILITIGIAIYLNIGWALRVYYKNNILHKTEEKLTSFQKLITGSGNFLADNDFGDRRFWCFALSFWWPMVIFIIILSWLLWLIFAGGIAKLLKLV